MQLDLTALSGPELRQMLDSARGRGQAAQSYEILQEMARRRNGEAQGGRRRRSSARRPREPRIITLDLGDPLDPDPDLDFPEAAPEPPLHLDHPAPPPPPAKHKPSPRRLPWLGAGLVMGVAAGVVMGIQMGPERLGLAAPADPTVREAPPAPVDAGAPTPTPAPAPAPAPAPVPVAPAEMTVEIAGAAPVPPPESLPAATESAPVEQAPAPIAPTPPVVVAEAKPEPPVCAATAAPADRAICENPGLRQLQRRLQAAYAEALAVHADRGLLRERQLAWRDDRSEVSDPDRLAELYKARIRKLNAATAEARRLKEG